MEKTTLGLIAALGASAAVPAVANASAPSIARILNPTSLAELLEPVANPVATLEAFQSQRQLSPAEADDTTVADATVVVHHHHHHHDHHAVIVRHRYHHHHHHHTVIVHHD